MAGRTRGQVLLRAGFVVYVLLMLWLLFGQRWGTQVYTQQLAESVNLKPFSTIDHYLALAKGDNPALQRHAIINLAGNVVMFIPLGFFIPKIWRRFRGIFRMIFTSLLLILAVELVQYLTMLGTCDIDDVILNMAGVIIGCLLSRLRR